jgi:hypothetical protein
VNEEPLIEITEELIEECLENSIDKDGDIS